MARIDRPPSIPILLFLILVWTAQGSHHPIPEETCSKFGSYPNSVNITTEERAAFHPVVIFPNRSINVIDNTATSGLASAKARAKARKRNAWFRKLPKRFVAKMVEIITFGTIRPWENTHSPEWGIGRYDEDRANMYKSAVFDDTNLVDGYAGTRTIHLGVDIGAPAGTKVYAFSDGVVHSAGYNEGFGDYGFVVVIEHRMPLSSNKVWALYGHMDRGTIQGKKPGTIVKKGQVIGRIGDCHENGGWLAPHCHFQMSIRPPETHDMPGACSMEDRPRALNEYLDPRYILGDIH
jgi:murein DD-endopeptidase MepM/ murein hydrolase activator NlpD